MAPTVIGRIGSTVHYEKYVKHGDRYAATLTSLCGLPMEQRDEKPHKGDDVCWDCCEYPTRGVLGPRSDLLRDE